MGLPPYKCAMNIINAIVKPHVRADSCCKGKIEKGMGISRWELEGSPPRPVLLWNALKDFLISYSLKTGNNPDLWISGGRGFTKNRDTQNELQPPAQHFSLINVLTLHSYIRKSEFENTHLPRMHIIPFWISQVHDATCFLWSNSHLLHYGIKTAFYPLFKCKAAANFRISSLQAKAVPLSRWLEKKMQPNPETARMNIIMSRRRVGARNEHAILSTAVIRSCFPRGDKEHVRTCSVEFKAKSWLQLLKRRKEKLCD